MKTFTRRVTTDDFARFTRELIRVIETKYAGEPAGRGREVAAEIVHALRETARDIERDQV